MTFIICETQKFTKFWNVHYFSFSSVQWFVRLIAPGALEMFTLLVRPLKWYSYFKYLALINTSLLPITDMAWLQVHKFIFQY